MSNDSDLTKQLSELQISRRDGGSLTAGQQATLPMESAEMHALLARLQDVATAPRTEAPGESIQGLFDTIQGGKGKGGEGVGRGDSLDENSNGRGHTSTERCVLEDYTRCSQSHLWELMMSFYDRKGVESWSQGIVPHFITCNAFIGRSYAHVLYGYIRDCVTGKNSMTLDPTEPFYIIELGTGPGKFSFFMLKALLEMKDISDFPVDKIVYVMTDFTESNFNFWASHPVLKPYMDSGQLDMAIFDAVSDTTIKLSCSGVELGPGTCKNPICIVANYLFDTLCHDVFQVDNNGSPKEGLISVGSKRAHEPDPLDPEIIQRLYNKFTYRDISDDYYKDEDGDEIHFRRILQWYVDYAINNPGGLSILFPVGALRALRRLMSFSNNRALVISGDKGNNNPEQFRGLMDPHIAVHGSFSVMVNYHAIGAYFTSRGGYALHNPQEEASLKVSAFVLTGDKEPDNGKDLRGDFIERMDEERSRLFPHLAAAFRTNVEQFGPNDFFVMQKCMKEDTATPTLKSVVALLKLGDWDPDVFYKFRDTILNQVSTAVLKLRKDLCRGIPRVWENYYMLDKEKDVAFEIGRFYYGIRDYKNALRFYQDSSENVGEHHVTFHNMGLCYYSMGELEKARSNFDKALELNSNYEKARSWHRKVQEELKASRQAVVGMGMEGIANGEGVAAMEGMHIGDSLTLPVMHPHSNLDHPTSSTSGQSEEGKGVQLTGDLNPQ
ncbi:unnamed protein product [Choristocarpus tenellus]